MTIKKHTIYPLNLECPKFNQFVFILVFIFSIQSKAQILNIDRVVNDSMPKNWYALIAASASFDKQKNDLIDVSLYSESVVKLKNAYGIVYVGQYDGTLSEYNFVKDEGYFQARLRDLDTRIKSLEFFIQYQWNGIWGMENRKLVGGNFRRRLFTNKNADGYLGLGTFYQSERWNYTGVEHIENTDLLKQNQYNDGFRSNIYLKIAKKIFKNCDLVVQNTIQSNLIGISQKPDIRWSAQAALTYDINKNFQLKYIYDHMYNQAPVVPINKFYYSYKFSVNLLF